MSVNQKQVKSFCSLAYLAKSTVATKVICATASTVNQNGDTKSDACSAGSSDTTATDGTLDATVEATPAVLELNTDATLADLETEHFATDCSSWSKDSGEGTSLESDVAGGAACAMHSTWEQQYCTSCEDAANNCTENGNSLSETNHCTQHQHHQRQRLRPQRPGHSQNSRLHHYLEFVGAYINDLDKEDLMDDLDSLTEPEDLQLAAELGKTLLERNKELESLLKDNKSNNEEKQREILHLRKQINAMTEVNDSRLKVYEQLEVGIQDLERANQRLTNEKNRDKKQIKSLTHMIETLEARCDELSKQVDELNQSLTVERRRYEQLVQKRNSASTSDSTNVTDGCSSGVRSPKETSANYNGNDPAVLGKNVQNVFTENCSFTFEHNNKANSTGLSESLSHEQSMELSVLNNSDYANKDDNEEILNLVNELEASKRAFHGEQQRCIELEEQLVAIIQENQTLQSRIAQTSTNEEMMSMHDEFSILDEVRQGQMCSRCLRAVEDRATNIDEQSSIAPTEDVDYDDERSLLDMGEGDGTEPINDNLSEIDGQTNLRRELTSKDVADLKVMARIPNSLDIMASASPNPYRDLVEKYEALLEVQRSSIARKSPDELTSLDASNSFELHQTEKAAGPRLSDVGAGDMNGGSSEVANSGSFAMDSCYDGKKDCKSGRGRTPTDYSEAETSSSGFSDETSNKYTQTDERPGYFLCSIGDGEDCKFSIYDDVSPIDSRFRNRPEYRELFKEIFAVLKKAAENKDEGDRLPLLDDTNPHAVAAAAMGSTAVKVPPVTPANEELPLPIDFGDDTQSIASSAMSEQSFAMSECITKLERKTAKKHIVEKNQENKPPIMETGSTAQIASPGMKTIVENGRVLTPFKREPLEYLTIGVGIKKKNRRKNRAHNNTERVESPLAFPSPPKFYVTNASGGRRGRKDMIPVKDTDSPNTERNGRSSRNPSTSSGANQKYEWNGSPMIIYNRNLTSARAARGREFEVNGVEYRPNTVSQEFHKLKKLDLSYAEVLRRADTCDYHQQQRPRGQLAHRRRAGNNINNNHHHH